MRWSFLLTHVCKQALIGRVSHGANIAFADLSFNTTAHFVRPSSLNIHRTSSTSQSSFFLTSVSVLSVH
jgi:hypothetical protein